MNGPLQASGIQSGVGESELPHTSRDIDGPCKATTGFRRIELRLIRGPVLV